MLQALNGGDVNIKDKAPVKRKFLALINPFGGGGGALVKWEKAKKLLDLAHLEIILKKTER